MDPSEFLEKHTAFWQPRSAGRALLARLDHPVWRPRPYPLSGGRSQEEPAAIGASDIDVDRLLGLDRALPAPFRDDLAQSVRTVYPIAWMESLIGCPIYASAYSCSSRPAVRGETALSAFPVTRALDSPWLGAMDAVLDREVSAAAGALPAAQLHLRGVSDMLAAYLGEERLCTALYDAPRELAALAESFARLYLRVAERDVMRRQAWRGGYVSVWGVYAPGPLLDYQMDASGMISAVLYREHLARFDELVLQAFPFSVLHLHASGLHLVDVVAGMEGVRCVEITLERETGKWEPARVLDACVRLKAAGKPILLSGELDEREISWFLGELGERGTAVFSWPPGTTRPSNTAESACP